MIFSHQQLYRFTAHTEHYNPLPSDDWNDGGSIDVESSSTRWKTAVRGLVQGVNLEDPKISVAFQSSLRQREDDGWQNWSNDGRRVVHGACRLYAPKTHGERQSAQSSTRSAPPHSDAAAYRGKISRRRHSFWRNGKRRDHRAQCAVRAAGIACAKTRTLLLSHSVKMRDYCRTCTLARFGKGVHTDRAYCRSCNTNDAVVLQIPFASNLLLRELQAMHISAKVDIGPKY